MEIKDIFSIGLGGAALLLSVYNTLRGRAADRVRLKVVPKLYWKAGTGLLYVERSPRLKELIAEKGRPGVAIEVTNLGKFPVTIDEIGFRSGKRSAGPRAVLPRPIYDEGVAWPTRLEPRASVLYRTGSDPVVGFSSRIMVAFARTACGHQAVGHGAAFAEWATGRI